MFTYARRIITRLAVAAALAALALIIPAAIGYAQSMDATDSLNAAPPSGAPGSEAQPPSASARAGTDSLFVLVPLRSTAEIQRDLEAAHVRRAEAETRTARSRVLQARSRTELDVQKTRLNAIQVQLKHAKQEKDATRRSELESQRTLAQLERRLLDRRDALRQQEIDVALADRELADAAAKAREAELALALKREEHARLMSAPTTSTVDLQTVERELQSLERRALQAQIDEATQARDFAQRESELAKSRLDVFEAQIKLLQSGGTLN